MITKKNMKIYILVIIGLVTLLIISGCIDEVNNNKYVRKMTPKGSNEQTTIGGPISQENIVSSSTSTILEKYDLKKLVSMSDNIVVGEVSNVLPSKWNTPDGKKVVNDNNTSHIIYTDANIKIGESLKGSLDTTTITVRTLGGTVDQDGQTVEDQPSYKANEKVLIFLKKDNDPRTKNIGGDHFSTVGLIQGKISISQNNEVILGDEKMSLDNARNIIMEKV